MQGILIMKAIMEENVLKIYFAGALFNSKDLIGNKILAETIERIAPKYKIILPQDLEQGRASPKNIRDNDLKNLLECDMGVFNYDGSELDSGTVVEFMFAKFSDKPSLLLRTDFRGGGDQTYGGGEPWNLMTSFYPRTRTLLLDSAKIYKDFLRAERFDLNGYCEFIAKRIISELDVLSESLPVMPQNLRPYVDDWIKILAK